MDLPITPAVVAVYRQAITDGDDSRLIALEKLTGATAFEIVQAGWTNDETAALNLNLKAEAVGLGAQRKPNEEAARTLHARAAEKVAVLRAQRKP